MTLGVYAVKDSKTGAFWRPFTHVNDATAHREFSNMVNDRNNDFMQQNYGDLTLYKLGEFDDLSGELCSNVSFLCNACDVKKVGE